jgi:hypothetical protein
MEFTLVIISMTYDFSAFGVRAQVHQKFYVC